MNLKKHLYKVILGVGTVTGVGVPIGLAFKFSNERNGAELKIENKEKTVSDRDIKFGELIRLRAKNEELEKENKELKDKPDGSGWKQKCEDQIKKVKTLTEKSTAIDINFLKPLVETAREKWGYKDSYYDGTKIYAGVGNSSGDWCWIRWLDDKKEQPVLCGMGNNRYITLKEAEDWFKKSGSKAS